MSQPTAEVVADRERIKSIISHPAASGQLKAAIAVALAGATVDEARVVLEITAGAMTPEEVARNVNGRGGGR